MDIGGWLRSLGLERCEAAFRENEIDDTVLPTVTAEDLKDLGVDVVGHRRKLLNAISALRATSRKSLSLPTHDEVLALGRLLRFGALCRGTGQSIHLSILAAVQAGGCELFCSDSGRTKAQANNDRNAIPKRSVFNSS